MRCGPLPFIDGELGPPHRGDEAPVPADRAPLDPRGAEIEGLEVHAGDPECGEQVAAPAADGHVATQVVAEASGDEREHDDGSHGERGTGRKVTRMRLAPVVRTWRSHV
jgi:hypothetical protein